MKLLINKRTFLLIVTLLLIQGLVLPAVARTDDALASKSGDHPRTRVTPYGISAQRNMLVFNYSSDCGAAAQDLTRAVAARACDGGGGGEEGEGEGGAGHGAVREFFCRTGLPWVWTEVNRLWINLG